MKIKTVFTALFALSLGGCSHMYTNDHIMSQDKSHFVSLGTVDPTISIEMRYFGSHNFTGRPVIGYKADLCLLTREAAFSLVAAQKELRKDGYSLKVQDCYRPQKSVNAFMAWSKDVNDQIMKKEFYPDVDKAKVFELGYIASQSGHTRGSTVDVILMKIDDPKNPEKQSAVDMGTPFDFFSDLSNTDNPNVSNSAHANRLILKAALEKQGFVNYAKEWWHYTLKDEPYPLIYFDFDVEALSGEPVVRSQRANSHP